MKPSILTRQRALLQLMLLLVSAFPLLLLGASTAQASGVPRAECFPIERLAPALRPKAEEMLLKMLDSEALYTVVGGLKPMSSRFATYLIPVKTPDTATLEEARQILAVFRCGDAFHADILPFHRLQNDRRYLEAVIFYRPALERMIEGYHSFFAPYGITPRTHPMVVALAIEHDPDTSRNRGLGYLYGYPKYAVDFFVESADKQKETKTLVPRDFINIPTFSHATNRFTYAVPKGHRENEDDRRLRAQAARILSAYRERRARYIGENKPGVVALLRDWFDDGTGFCAPENARFYDAAPAAR